MGVQSIELTENNYGSSMIESVGAPGDGPHVAGLLAQTSPIREEICPLTVEDAGYNRSSYTRGGHRGRVVGVFDCGLIGRRFESALCRSPRGA